MKWKKKKDPVVDSLQIRKEFAVVPTLCSTVDEEEEYVWLESFVAIRKRTYSGWRTVQRIATTDVTDTRVLRFIEQHINEAIYYNSERLSDMFDDPRYVVTSKEMKDEWNDTVTKVTVTPV